MNSPVQQGYVQHFILLLLWIDTQEASLERRCLEILFLFGFFRVLYRRFLLCCFLTQYMQVIHDDAAVLFVFDPLFDGVFSSL